MANNNVPVVDLPFFELCNFAPVATAATSGLTTSETGDDRYIYYLSGTNFYKYDTVADTFVRLATPPTAVSGTMSMRFTKRRGFHGRVLGATSTTVTIPGLRGPTLNGAVIRIEHGTGAGQERTLTYTGETIHDYGVMTSTSGNNTITDTLKKWRVNQWAGYQVAVVFGTGVTYYKKVIYNSSDTLYFFDSAMQPYDPWNNMPLNTVHPYVNVSATAGAQTHYQIMSSNYTVSAWNTIPDRTSFFTTLTGGIYLVSSASGTAFATLQYYDAINDAWQTKTVPQTIVNAALGTDVSIERTGKIGTALVTGTASSGTSRTMVDSSKSLTNNRYANHRILITGGTGMGQTRRIVAHTATTFTVPRAWDVTPDNTSTYEIWPDFDRLYISGNGASALFAYSADNDFWMQGQAFDDSIANNIAAVYGDWLPLGVNTGVRIAAGVTGVASTPTAGGTNYSIGDVLTCSVGGTGAQVRVTAIAPGGIVSSIELINSGTATGFTTGAGKATTGGTGTGCTIEITSVGATATITLHTNHWLTTGEVVTFYGCNEAAWNTAHTIIGVPAINTFCVAVTATANMAAAASQSSTTIVDVTKNWITNEHVGRIVHLVGSGTSPASQPRWITANTATTLTVASITAATNGTSRYVIYDSKVFGIDAQRKETAMEPYGWATSGSTTTLVDNTKNWVPNQWAGYLFRIEAGTGYGSGRISIISNTATTLTFATQTFTPDATTYYEIADSWGLATAGTGTTLTETGQKNWATNQWAGKRVRHIAGSSFGAEATISSNTNNTLTTNTNADATTAYAIVGIMPRGGNTQLVWNHGCTDSNKKARYFYSFRGGNTNVLDIYDITTGRWQSGYFYNSLSEYLTTGSSYAYDGGDNIYFSVSTGAVPIRIMKYNMNTNIVSGAATTTIVQGTATIGNFMEIIETSGGYPYLYTMQNTGQYFCRALIF